MIDQEFELTAKRRDQMLKTITEYHQRPAHSTNYEKMSKRQDDHPQKKRQSYGDTVFSLLERSSVLRQQASNHLGNLDLMFDAILRLAAKTNSNIQ